MSEGKNIVNYIINISTPPNIMNQPHNFSDHRVHRFLTTLSNLDMFAADLVTHIMGKHQFPHIPTMFFGCVGTPPNSWLPGILLKKVDEMYPLFLGLQSMQSLLKTDDLTYDILRTNLAEVIYLGNLHSYLSNHQLLEQLVLIACLGTLGYGKGLKIAPTMSVNYIRYVLYVYRLSENRLFALELVSCVTRRYSLPFHPIELSNKHDKHGRKLKRRFSNYLWRAVRLLVPTVTNFDYQTYLASGETDEQRFHHLSDSLFIIFFANGFTEIDFLLYCVHIAKLASRALLNGVKIAPYLAVDVITDTMEYFYSNMDFSDDSWTEIENESRQVIYHKR